MTELEVRQKVLNTAKQYLGCKESDGSHKKIIDIYNGHKPLARGYAVKYTDAWCATFVSAVSILCGYTDIMFTECGCGAMIQLYQNAGRWQERDDYVPSPADIIMYDWDDSGNDDCGGYPEHVGLVESVSGNTIKVIEGNKSDAVGYRTLAVNGRYIRGYCLPNYAAKATGETSGVTDEKPADSGSTSSGGLNRSVKWTGRVTASSLNVRTWAGTEYDECSFSPIDNGAEIDVCDTVQAKDSSLWYYIKHNGKYGFVHSAYVTKNVEESSGASKPDSPVSVKDDYARSKNDAFAGTYETTANLNLRTGAVTSKPIQLTIPKGDKVTCYGFYTAAGGVNWYLVAYQTKTGFVSSEYLKRQ